MTDRKRGDLERKAETSFGQSGGQKGRVQEGASGGIRTLEEESGDVDRSGRCHALYGCTGVC